MWEEAWFSISIREITFREQELNWLFAKYKRLENNPLYGMLDRGLNRDQPPLGVQFVWPTEVYPRTWKMLYVVAAEQILDVGLQPDLV